MKRAHKRLAIFLPLASSHTSNHFHRARLSRKLARLLLTGDDNAMLDQHLIFIIPRRLIGLSVGPFPRLPRQHGLMRVPLHFASLRKAPIRNIFSIDLASGDLIVPSALSNGVHSSVLLASSLGKCVRGPNCCFLGESTHARCGASLLVLARN